MLPDRCPICNANALVVSSYKAEYYCGFVLQKVENQYPKVEVLNICGNAMIGAMGLREYKGTYIEQSIRQAVYSFVYKK